MTKIGVLILNFNGEKWLEPLFLDLAKQIGPEIKIYLIDNASEDGSVDFAISRHETVTVLRNSENVGYSMAYNLAIPHALSDGCDWVILSNNDIRVVSDCIKELLRVAETAKDAGILGPCFLDWDGDGLNYYMRSAQPAVCAAIEAGETKPIEVKWVEGSFLMLRRECYEAIGPLDPMYFFYWEEVDLCRRARFQNWKVLLVPKAIARHYAGGSTSPDKQNSFELLKTKNYYLFTLTDPFNSWPRNLLTALHLAVVRLRQAMTEGCSGIKLEMFALYLTLSNLKSIHGKWQRDRRAEKPPAYCDPFLNVECRRIT
jgi:hypothetical protein